MNKVILSGLLLIALFGCIIPQTAFEYEDIKSPCNVVSAGEVRALYGFKGIEETPVVEENYTFCVFSGQTTSNGTNPVSRNQIMIMYVPYAQTNETIKEYYNFENQSEVAFIDESDLGIGDYSFLSMSIEKNTSKIQYISAVVFKDDSAIIITDAGYMISGVDYKNKEKLKELAKIALNRLTS